MRIVVVNTAASSGGALAILRDFYNYVKKNGHKHEWIFLLSDHYIDETDNIKIIINKEVKHNWFRRLKWELKEGATFINELHPDVVFSMQNTISRGIKVPNMVYLHQSIPFQKVKKFSFFDKTEMKMAIYQYIIGAIIKKSLKKTNKIVVQTQWMKIAVEACKKIAPYKVIVAPPTVIMEEYLLKAEYGKINKFFYPSGPGIYKNHEILIKCVENLVNDGFNNFEIEFTLDESYKQKMKINKKVEKHIKFIGQIPREKVFEKYRTAVLLFPSYIETFGLPLLEARMINSFIIASDCEFSREVLDGYMNCEYFNPFSVEEITEKMKRILLEGVQLKEEVVPNLPDEGWKKIIINLEELNL